GGPKPEPLGQPAEAPIASGQAQGLAAGSDAGGNRGGPGRPTNQAGNPRLERAAAPHGRMRGVFAQKARHQSVSIVNSMSETRWSFLTLPRKVQGCETSGKSKTQGDNGLFRAPDEWSGNQNHADFPWKTANPGLRKSRNVQIPSEHHRLRTCCSRTSLLTCCRCLSTPMMVPERVPAPALARATSAFSPLAWCKMS